MIYQKPTKTITDTTYTTSDADNGHRIILSNASGIAVTLHTATGRYNFEIEFDNIGEGDCTVGGQTLKQYTHAHVGNNGGSAWSVVVGGGSMSKAEIEAVLTGEISSHSHALTKSAIEAVLTGKITTHTHPGATQNELVTNGDEADPEIVFFNGDIVTMEV
jgi:hypothetical protein